MEEEVHRVYLNHLVEEVEVEAVVILLVVEEVVEEEEVVAIILLVEEVGEEEEVIRIRLSLKEGVVVEEVACMDYYCYKQELNKIHKKSQSILQNYYNFNYLLYLILNKR